VARRTGSIPFETENFHEYPLALGGARRRLLRVLSSGHRQRRGRHGWLLRVLHYRRVPVSDVRLPVLRRGVYGSRGRRCVLWLL